MNMTTTTTEQKHSPIIQAAIRELQTNHKQYHEKLWSSTTGQVVGEIQHTPKGTFDSISDPPIFHSNWLPELMGSLIAKTEKWCDITTLYVPEPEEESKFMEEMQDALKKLDKKSRTLGKRIVVRILFAHIVTLPVNCNELIKKFMDGIEEKGSMLQVWVGGMTIIL